MRPEPNYRPDRNPFHLVCPPSWWLRGVAVFDPDLILIPSRRKPVHVLGRRRRLSRSLATKLDGALDDPAHTTDSALCEAYGLVYVTTVFCAFGAWSQQNLRVLLDELRRRDTWAVQGGPLTPDQQRAAVFAGGSKVTALVDAADEADRQRITRQVRDDLWHATGDAWRSRQARMGARSKLTTGRRLIATPRPMPAHRPEGV